MQPATDIWPGGNGNALDDLPLLRLLSDDARALVVNSVVPASFSFGTVIAREGDRADTLYLIVSGRARLLKQGEHGEELSLGLLRAGDSFGEAEILDGSPRPSTVRASTD